jgi:hypothetical protein
MKPTKFLHTANFQSPVATLRTSAGFGLPADMLQTARGRVGRLSATLALLIVAGFVSNLVRAALG